jgi:hypothetical protein
LSKHKDQTQLGEWQVRHTATGADITIAESWWERDKAGGYTFYDTAGDVTADFPPGTVTAVRRVTHALTGFAPGRHGGEEVGCTCGARFAGVTREHAEELIRAHGGGVFTPLDLARIGAAGGGDYSEAAR